MRSYKFFPKVYTDEETKRLSEEYDIKTFSGYVPNSLGQIEDEIGAEKLLNLSKLIGEIVGVNSKDVEQLDCDSEFYEILGLREKYARTKNRKNLEILFPTEELLISQRVQKK
ncbi:MAG: hypothetical protein PHQ66_00790 [Candidatus Nanoarchaeia archaeon]|nr:hypothetical protein [Candidatus Nanoarchaeia archaeon]MDD5358485.1 hypothetical protein [Candidatus Nanoarchaeia archaeon]MDD5588999.1 hypothetical protein [Candidatus Nanoarchaeia archaeon]